MVNLALVRFFEKNFVNDVFSLTLTVLRRKCFSVKQNKYRQESFIQYVRKIFRKTNISYPLLRTRTCFVFLKPLFLFFIFNQCHIWDRVKHLRWNFISKKCHRRCLAQFQIHLCQLTIHIILIKSNLFQSSVAFHIDNSHLIRKVNQITGSYMKCKNEMKWVNLPVISF